MILIHISTNDEQLGEEIAEFLVEDRLIVDAFIMNGIRKFRTTEGKVVLENQILVMGKTKAILFDTIDKILKQKYGAKLPTLYSVPIVHMDWNQSKDLKEQTKQMVAE